MLCYSRRTEEESLPWPSPRSYHSMASTADERHIYMFGGKTSELSCMYCRDHMHYVLQLHN